MQHEEFLQQFYASIKAGNTEAIKQCIHADFELHWQGTDALPWAGHWKGVAGLLEFFRILNEHVEVLAVNRLETLSSPQLTFVLLQGQWRIKRNGKEITALAANVFKFKEELISSYTVLNNSAAFAESLM